MDPYKFDYTLLKTWCVTCYDGCIDNEIKVLNDMFVMPKMWQNIIDNIIASYKYMDGAKYKIDVYNNDSGFKFPKHFEKKKYGEIIAKIIELDLYSLKSSEPANPYNMISTPYFIDNNKLIPLMLVTLAASSLYRYSNAKDCFDAEEIDVQDYGQRLKTIMNLMGLPKTIPLSISTRGDKAKTYAALFIRSYFASKTIQQAWRSYKQSYVVKTKQQTEFKSTTQITQVNNFNDEYKIKYALIKYWIDYCGNNRNEELENIIKQAYTKLPSFWNNILDFVISSYLYIDPDYTNYHNPDAEELIEETLECIRYKIDERDGEYDDFMVPDYLKNSNQLPFHIISKAGAAVHNYDFINDDTYKKRFLGICGIPQDITVEEYLSDYKIIPYGLALMRSYFSTKIIQRHWRAYVIKKQAVKTIQRVWKRQISSPFTVIGMNRLQREFSEMIEV